MITLGVPRLRDPSSRSPNSLIGREEIQGSIFAIEAGQVDRRQDYLYCLDPGGGQLRQIPMAGSSGNGKICLRLGTDSIVLKPVELESRAWKGAYDEPLAPKVNGHA